MNSFFRSHYLVLFVLLTSSLGYSPSAHALSACVQENGTVKIKRKCKAKKGEQVLSLNLVAANVSGEPGPKGPKGDKGDPGQVTNTGSGSGLDADLLDGQDSSSFAQQSDLSNLGAALNDLSDDVAILSTPPANVVRVAKSGGDYTSLADALSDITDSSDSNPYFVQIGPGIFSETNLSAIPEFVHVRGSGPSVTVIESSRTGSTQSNSAATIEMMNNSRLSNLTVRNSGTGVFGIALYLALTERTTIIDHVVAEAIGVGGTGHYAVYLNDAEPTIQGSVLRASGAIGFGTAVNAAVGVC